MISRPKTWIRVKSATGDATTALTQTRSGAWRGKKAAPWSSADLSAVQNALDTTAALTPQLDAQERLDGWPIEQLALVLALIDQLNVICSKLSPPLPDITPAQAIAALQAKAGTLS